MSIADGETVRVTIEQRRFGIPQRSLTVDIHVDRQRPMPELVALVAQLVSPDASEAGEGRDARASAGTIIDRLLIDRYVHRQALCICNQHNRVGQTRRLFDVTGIPICEDCIPDIAPVVAQLAAALEEEREE